MATPKAIVIGSGEIRQIQSGDYISSDSLGSGSAGTGLKVLLDNNTFATPPSGNLVYSNTSASSAIANTVAETAFTIPSYTIPANALVAGSVLRIKLWGWYSTALVSPNITAKIKLGGTTYLTTGAVTSVAGASNAGWFADCVLTVFTTGSSGTVDAQAYAEFSTAATTGLSVNIPNPNTQVLDTTVSQAVTVTVQWSSASASNTITLQNSAIYIENLSTSATAGTFLQKGDVSYYRKTGTTTLERWYSSNIAAFTSTTVARAKDLLVAIPYVVVKTCTLDRIGMNITGAGTALSVVRLAIYDDVNGIPTNLILDAGTIAGDSATFQSITINQPLNPGLYYLVLNHNSVANITFTSMPIGAVGPTIGLSNNLTTPSAGIITSTLVYTTMPSTFTLTGIAAVNVTNVPIISVRLSS